jgi:putative oxidoreductase
MDGRSAMALLILRAFVGYAFVLHGYGKLHKIRLFAGKFALPWPIAAFVVYAQLLGGCLLIVGLLTPVASVGIGLTMVGAIAKCMGRGEKFIDPEHHSWESAGFYLVALIVIALLGPGRYSLDALLFR